MEKYKTVIAGAGPGGLRCAKILAENNEDFVLLEKNPRLKRKICTGIWGLTKKTEYMGLPNSLFKKKFKKIIFSTPHRKVEVKMGKPFVATLNRLDLSRWMFKEAKKSGANIVFDSPVSQIKNDCIITNGKKIKFDNLVGADGSYSIVRKSLGLPQHVGMGIQYWINRKFKYLEVHLDADKFGPWYSWIVPHKRKTSIGTGADPRWIPSKKLKENLDLWCSGKGIDVSSAEFEWAPINYDYRGYKFKNKFLVGDAAGFTSGLSGEGIYFAMASGEDVAKTIVNKNHKPLLIQRVLEIKKKHELIAEAFKLNKTLEKIEYNVLLSLLKLKFFDKKTIDLLG